MNGALNLHPKVAAGGLSGAASVLVLWLLSLWVDVPAAPAGALTALLVFAGGWLAPTLPTEIPFEPPVPAPLDEQAVTGL